VAFTAIACAMCLYVAAVGGVTAGFVALAIGLFNSIMFPLIFTITLERSSASAEATSGLLCTAIVGGALIPLLVGKFSEFTSYHAALLIPAACYAVLCLFALASRRAHIQLRDEPAAATIH
jgi:FHS family L-fucose permease-like MFS transporter